MDEPAGGGSLKGKRVVTSDGVVLGDVEAEVESHLRVRCEGCDGPEGYLWIPRTMVAEVGARTVHLHERRADLHDAVLALSPGQQREYGSLEPTVKIGRARWLGTRE